MRIEEIDFSGRMKLDGYGGGGFRVSGHFSEGSLLLLPSGPKSWRPRSLDQITTDDLTPIIAEASEFEVLLLGLGPRYQAVPREITQALRAAGIRVDIMDSGAAARTFNILLTEDRRVAAALIVID